MPYIVSFLVFVLLAAIEGLEEGIFFGAATLIALFYFSLRKNIKNLSAELAEIKEKIATIGRSTESHKDVKTVDAKPASGQPPQTEIEEPIKEDLAPVVETQVVAQAVPPKLPPTVQIEDDAFTLFFMKIYDAVYSVVYKYFTDGNLFVRIGILILFVGVSFLLKYASDHSNVPVEYRIAGVALGGFAVLFFGWRIRKTKGVYALLLQGAGIGVLYLAFFSSFKVYEILPPTLTFVLLVALGIAAVVLAVLQNSKALAAFGIVGGFVAPILASTGSGNYVGLFSYYLLLNIGVMSTAWFKSWRVVNLIGFAFTFIVYTAWFALKYKTEYIVSADVFLILFFFLYSAISVLFAIRQPLKLKGYVDGTLVFGTPMVVWGLQMAMMDTVEYGVAISALLFGLYHIALARYLWNKHNEGMQLFALSLLSIGVVFLTLAIPYSLDGHWTSATWALEGAGILWVSLKQNKKFAQYFSVLLQLVAAGIFLEKLPSWREDLTPVLNPYFLGGIFISISSFFSAWLLYKYAQKNEKSFLLQLNPAMFLWAILWWISIGMAEIRMHTHSTTLFSVFSLSYFMATSAIAWFLSKRLEWKHAKYTSLACLAFFILLGLGPIFRYEMPFVLYDGIVWVAVLVYSTWLLKQFEQKEKYHSIVKSAFLIFTIFYIALVCSEFVWLLEDATRNTGEAWQLIAYLAVPCLAVYYLLNTEKWPFVQYNYFVSKNASAVYVTLMLFWSFIVNVFSNGDPSPINYYPLLNPIDIMHVVILVLTTQLFLKHGDRFSTESSQTTVKNYYLRVMAAITFVWINAILLRTLSHHFDIYYEPYNLWRSTIVQVSLSILWTVLGMLAMIVASRIARRKLWIAGAVLVGIVLVKLIFIDLSASGTVERIISFMVVGLLLVGMGYFSPIPVDKEEKTKTAGS